MKQQKWEEVLTVELKKAEKQLSFALAVSCAPKQHPDAIHLARTSIKTMRAAFRLLREAFPVGEYRVINQSLREAGQAISLLRDQEVLRKTVVKLTAKTRGSRSAEPTRPISRRPISNALRKLKAIGGHFRCLPWASIDLHIVKEGLKRLYRQGKKAARLAHAKRSNRRLHTWRKRVKDLGYALFLSGFGESVAEAQVLLLSEHLGEDHDLAVFQEKNHMRPDKKALDCLAWKDRYRHQKKAFRIGRCLFSARAGQFIEHVKEC